MTEDRSLDEFLGGDTSGRSAGDAETDDESGAGDATGDGANEPVETDDGEATALDEEAENPSDADAADDVTPAVGTYRWDPEGVECPACGETADRLWLDDDAGAQVCADCKAW